jgi:hypothetical protein
LHNPNLKVQLKEGCNLSALASEALMWQLYLRTSIRPLDFFEKPSQKLKAHTLPLLFERIAPTLMISFTFAMTETQMHYPLIQI